MLVPLVQQIQAGATNVAQALADIASGLEQINSAVPDLNRQPTPGTGTNAPTDLLGQVKGALADVNKAAQLRDLLPVVIVVVGVLAGRALLGVILAVLGYYYGQPVPPPSRAAPAATSP